MPRKRLDTDVLNAVVTSQDYVLHRRQAYAHGLSRHAVAHRQSYHGWQEILRNVFLCHGGDPSRRQRLVAALLYAGPDAAIDSDDACAFHGVRAVRPDDSRVHVAVPAGSTARSHSFVVVRRSGAGFGVVSTELLRYVDPATALIATARQRHDSKRVLAILSDGLQRRIVTQDDLTRAHVRGAPKNARATDDALAQLRPGVHAVGEAEFRLLAEASATLPALSYNALLRLPDGQLVSPDAIALDAGLVHEVNGRSAHARADLFADMQARHDAMTAAGLVVLHNPPARIRREPRQVLGEVERCYARLAGRGLPPGVVLLRSAASAA